MSAKAASDPAMPSATMRCWHRCRLHDDALDEILQPHARVQFGIHGGAARGRAAAPPGVLADQELVIEAEAARLQPFEHHDHGHDLAHAGRMHEFVGVLLEQHLAGPGVHQDGLLGPGFERRRRLRVRFDKSQSSQRKAESQRQHGVANSAGPCRQGADDMVVSLFAGLSGDFRTKVIVGAR
jgi:hypothetical protein